ncbi:MAG: histidine kinase, partial [Chitinophagaceae bacterium]|nr:histidine kinase [Chitinophagaceae bacterium]
RMPDGRVCVDYFGRRQYTMIDPLTGQVTHLPLSGRPARDWVVHALLESGSRLPSDRVLDVLVQKLRARQISPEAIRGLIADTSSNAWIVVFNALRHSGTGHSISLPEIPIDVSGTGHSISLPEIPIDVKSDGGAMWLAFPGQGLWRFEPGSRQLRRMLTGEIATGDITCILPGDSGLLWVGTKGAGIYRVFPRTGTYRQFTTDQGLAHNSVYGMTQDHRGRIWVGTANGLSCMDPKRGSFQQFFKGHGFANTEYNRHSAITLDDGRIAVGGMNGIDLFHPDSLDYDTRETIVQLTDVKVHNISRGVRDVYRLKHDEHMVSVHFAVMDFRQPERNLFQYRLGHEIRIRGADSDGHWSTKDLVLRLDVQPAWYQRWWFYLLLSALAAGMGYLLFTYRLRQKLQVYRVRQRIHRDLHDDVGATLSSVKAYAEILAEHPDNPVIPSLIADNASEMIERLEVIAWAADPHHDRMASLRNKIVKYATPVCHAQGVEFTCILEGIDENLEVPGEIRQHLFMVCKEAIHNMAKYAAATHCAVRMRVTGRTFEMSIQDNGKGSDGTIRGTGQGWKNMETRARDSGGTVDIRTAPGQGTHILFKVRFPFSIPNSWGRNGQ